MVAASPIGSCHVGSAPPPPKKKKKKPRPCLVDLLLIHAVWPLALARVPAPHRRRRLVLRRLLRRLASAALAKQLGV